MLLLKSLAFAGGIWLIPVALVALALWFAYQSYTTRQKGMQIDHRRSGGQIEYLPEVKPAWTVIPTFWAAVLMAVLALAFVVVRAATF